MCMLQVSDPSWAQYYFCLVDSFMYFYKEVAPVEGGGTGGGEEADEGGNDAEAPGSGAEVKWKGCINLKLAKVCSPIPDPGSNPDPSSGPSARHRPSPSPTASKFNRKL